MEEMQMMMLRGARLALSDPVLAQDRDGQQAAAAAEPAARPPAPTAPARSRTSRTRPVKRQAAATRTSGSS